MSRGPLVPASPAASIPLAGAAAPSAGAAAPSAGAAAPPSPTSPDAAAVLTAAQQICAVHRKMIEQMERVIVGQTPALELILLALFCQGHVILEGVPGLAKTLMISTLSQLLSMQFRRIQFTPDLMPSDITGTEYLEENKATGHRQMRFVRGPVFTNILLADEINRTPPKTQAALLQAMQEHQVTIAGTTYQLDPPFFVLGTQNPIENEGTYPLPEAQLDRFMFKVRIGYPALNDEVEIAMQTTSKRTAELQPLMTRKDILLIQEYVRQVIVARPVANYAVRLARATRPGPENKFNYVNQYLTWGAGPRACQALLLGAKARALLDGRPQASIDDVRFVARPVLRHRVVANFTAESEGIDADGVVGQLLHDLPELP